MGGVWCLCQVYRQVASPAVMTELLMEYLEEYNITFPSQMHLVFFNDALHHISRICRVLRQPRGNALLVRQTSLPTPPHIRKGEVSVQRVPAAFMLTKCVLV